jgi:hypothetical protein
MAGYVLSVFISIARFTLGPWQYQDGFGATIFIRLQNIFLKPRTKNLNFPFSLFLSLDCLSWQKLPLVPLVLTNLRLKQETGHLTFSIEVGDSAEERAQTPFRILYGMT